ncbi:Purine nucleoside phosphorylase 1 [Enhygromyxa salina]|uniref:Purine nucleoside phosphorylase n=1 Tax=Enhygromyxa salina TaxID=215803 RepID=A0A2S9YH81_9BACT|nr:purine-nucleoside phosphorylase [Enhygromyxa salina]PRQ04376.1 Purine nucleoside phosphorylase 1 [Enhygromyxa salina]
MTDANTQVGRLDEALADLRQHTKVTPKVALVLGSGLGSFADTLAAKTVVPFGEIRHMPVSKVVGHAGNLVVGEAAGMPVVAMQGRVHLYEGHPVVDVVFGLRLMLRMGAEVVVITNAAGGCGDGMEAGDLMLITDHLNLTGQNPLIGLNEPELGVRFPDMTQAYDPELGALAKQTAAAGGFSLREGVYAGLLGPTYETPAEVQMLRGLGAHAVGMSTVLEVIAARHMGARVLGISCITNKAAGISDQPLSHDEVTETATRVRGQFIGLLEGVLSGIAAGG